MDSALSDPNVELDPAVATRIRLEAERAEKIGKMTPNQLGLIHQYKWFHLLVPRVYGGQELALPVFAHLMENLARLDGSLAWTVNLGAGANMFAGYMDSEIAKSIFADPKTCIAGSGAVSGTAVKRGDTYVIEGRWKYASGADHATHFSLNAQVLDEAKHGAHFLSFIVPASEVEVHETWHPIGLRATASHDFSVHAVAVPATYAFDLQEPSPVCSGALYRFPFVTLAEINMLVMVTGLAMRFLELVSEIAACKVIHSDKAAKELLSEHQGFRLTVHALENQFKKDRAAVFEHLQLAWERVERGDVESNVAQARFTEKVLQAAQSSRALVDGLYPYMGMHAIFETATLNRVWRGFKVASQHALLAPARL